MSALWLALSAAYGLLGVIVGAFGAHALRARLTPELMAVWHTAVEYQFYHALALGLTGLLLRGHSSRVLEFAGGCFALGVLLFSGSLYVLILSGVKQLGAITPFGGLLLMVGWTLLLIAALRPAR